MRRTVLKAALGFAALGGVADAPLAAQSNLTATAPAPTKVVLNWTGAAGSNGYWILRGVGTAALAKINPAKVSGTSYTDLTAPAGTALRYRVRATYPNGPNTDSDRVSVTTPGQPAGTASSAPPPSTASAVPSSPTAGTYELLPLATPVLVAPRTLAPATGPAPAAPAASPPPAPVVSGKYRVVANGFSVVQQGHSHHDDVYGGFIMLHFDRQTGQLKNQDARRTKILGDINGRVFGEPAVSPDRLRAGTASPTGGLKNGDSYPDASRARIRGQGGAPPNRETFPFEVWTGDLTNSSDGVIILPTLWSRDGKTQPFDNWQNAELSAASQIWWDPAVQEALRQTTLGVIAPPGAATPNASSQWRAFERLGAAFLGQSWALETFDPTSKDRPIGLDPTARGLPRRAIVLTREMIEQTLNGPKAPLLPTMVVPNYPAWILPYLDVPVGVIPVLLSDYVPPPGEPLRWTYVMYLQVERM